MIPPLFYKSNPLPWGNQGRIRRVDDALAEHTLFCNNMAMGASKKELTPAKAAAVFISFTAYFYVLLFTTLKLLA